MSDAVNPEHYKNTERKQLIEVIRLLPFSVGNALKYLYRFEGKGKPVEDLKKALWYFEDYLSNPCRMRPEDELKLTPELFDEIYNVDGEYRKIVSVLVIETYFTGKKEYSDLAKQKILDKIEELSE